MTYLSDSFVALSSLEEADAEVHPKLQRCKEVRPKLNLESAAPATKGETAAPEASKPPPRFRELFGKRYLFLAPPNEFNCQKFVCSSLKLTLLPFPECYQAEGLASFISDYFFYETLHPPDRCPPCLPSVDCLFRWRRGDSFDLSICLASCLLGAGYDAYCVVGTAVKAITTNDQVGESLSEFKIEMPKPQRFEALEKLAERRERMCSFQRKSNIIKKKRRTVDSFCSFVSKLWLSGMCAICGAKAFLASGTSTEEEAARKRDVLEGRRVHCWVLLLAGARGVAENLYINPPSGRIYRQRDSPFLAVHFLWNQENFWVNMRPQLKAQDISFSLNKTRFFECVLSMPPKAEVLVDIESSILFWVEGGRAQADDRDSQLFEFGADKKQSHLNALLAPRAWARPPRVEAADFASRFFGGQKVIFYKDAKLQEFPPYSQPDGLVRRLTFFSDSKQTLPEEVYHQFKHRRKVLYGLEERIFLPLARTQVERYSPASPHALREVVEVHGEKRELYFYKSSRLDGLVKHTELYGTKIKEEFEGRDDGLLSHSLKLMMGEGNHKSQETLTVFGAPATILRVSEKFRRLSESDDVLSISKLVYWAEGRVRIEFHPPQNSIIKPVVYLKRVRSLLQYDSEALPFSGACRAPPPTEAEVARYRRLQKDLVTRFSSSVLVRAEAVHTWRKQQEAAVHASRKTEEQKLLSQKMCILRHDEDLTGAARVDKAVGDDSAAAAAASSGEPDSVAAEGQGHATAYEQKEERPRYSFCKHATLVPSFSAIAMYTAHDPNSNRLEEKKETAQPEREGQQARPQHRQCSSSSSSSSSNSSSSNGSSSNSSSSSSSSSTSGSFSGAHRESLASSSCYSIA
ncbi:hypothetical protein Esti_001275 [Eimeria stiedai]